MNQITITRDEYRKKAFDCVAELTADAIRKLETGESAVIALYGTVIAARVEKELFGKETEED